MSANIDTRISPALHPVNVQKLDGYSEETAGILAMTESAFAHAYEQLAKVFDVGDTVRADPTLTEAAAVLKIADYADKAFVGIAQRFDAATANLKTIVASIESNLTAPVESRASNTLSAEIRAYCKSLPDGERMSFVVKAIKDNDTRSATAVLGAPAYLSGLTNDMQAVLTRQFHETHEPLKAKRLKAAKAGLDLIGERGGLVFSVIQKAVKADPQKVAKLRAAAAKTAKALALDA
ncbi:MAG: hypothetical protein ACXIT4_07935 [Erythrobacter sp.]